MNNNILNKDKTSLIIDKLKNVNTIAAVIDVVSLCEGDLAILFKEITDDVVKLIAYNKEAFGDFASIKNQEDVNSFNEKYGVELVIDVATV